jgi:hypothetical protein
MPLGKALKERVLHTFIHRHALSSCKKYHDGRKICHEVSQTKASSGGQIFSLHMGMQAFLPLATHPHSSYVARRRVAREFEQRRKPGMDVQVVDVPQTIGASASAGTVQAVDVPPMKVPCPGKLTAGAHTPGLIGGRDKIIPFGLTYYPYSGS